MTVNPDRVQHVVDRLAEKLGRSVSIDDRNRVYVTSSRHFGDLDDLRLSVLLSRQLNDEASAYLFRFVDAQAATGPIRVPANADLGIRVRHCYPIRIMDRPVGYLWLIGEISEDEDHTVSAALPDLAHVLSQQPDRPRDQEEAVWTQFVETLSRPHRTSDTLAFWDEHDFYPQTQVAAVVAYAPRPWRNAEDQAKLLDRLINRSITDRRFLPTRLVTRGSVSIALIRGPHGPLPEAPVLSLRFFADESALEGTSLGVSDWGGIAESEDLLTQAGLSAFIANTSNRPVVSWSESGYQGVLLQAALADPARVVPQVVTQLSKTRSGTELIKTLSAFLAEGGDIAKASERLNIHRTTLYYRIARIEEITGFDLKDGNDRLELHLGINLASFLDSDVARFLHSEEN